MTARKCAEELSYWLYWDTAGCHIIDAEKKMEEIIEKHMAQREARLVEALEIILPMAKGYAAEHPVGNNQDIVNEVESLTEHRQPREGTR